MSSMVEIDIFNFIYQNVYLHLRHLKNETTTKRKIRMSEIFVNLPIKVFLKNLKKELNWITKY